MKDSNTLLTNYICELKVENLPASTIQFAKKCIIDAIASTLAGSTSKTFDKVLKAYRISGSSDGDFNIWGTSQHWDILSAIFLNTYAAAYYDIDDGSRKAQGHPGAAIIPAVLAVGQKLKSNGKEIIEAIVVGYDIAVRSALVMREQGGVRKGSSAWATVGTAAAIAKLFKLGSKEVLHAIGIAEYVSPQSNQDRSASYPNYMKEALSFSSTSGYRSAALAAGGITGMRPVLADSKFLNDLGSNYEIDNTYYKMYACCRWTHPAINALGDLRNEFNFKSDEIESINIIAFERALLLKRNLPKNTLEAVYSIPFAVASYLVFGAVGPDQVRGKSLKNQQVLDLAKRINIIADDSLTKQWPIKCLQKVQVILKNKTQHASDIYSSKGDPDNPYSYKEIEEKFNWLSENVIGVRAQEVVAMVADLEDCKNISELNELLSE